MSEYTKIVETMECDCYFQLPPKQILEHCLSLTLMDMIADGAGRATLEAKLGAVWMISHMRYYQFCPIGPGDMLTYRTFPRVVEGNRYIYYVEIFLGDTLAIRFDTSYIPVYKAERRVVRLNLLDPLWRTPARTAESRNLRRLRPDCSFVPCGSDTVRLSDCDANGHMTSGAYLSLACNALDFWAGETPRYMQMMQVDFISEVRPGTELHFERGEKDGVRYLRGLKPDGTVAFAVAARF